jgi:AcrR family transcriptional regulator
VIASSRTSEFVQRLATPDPAVLAQLENPDRITERILAAALAQAEEVGMRRSTMDDVARRSGVGRATLYRRFPTKAALNDAIVLSEVRRFFEGSAKARAHGETLEDRLVYGTVFSVTFMREHVLLKKLLRTEPETILPSLTVDAGPLLDFATDQSIAMLRNDLHPNRLTTPAQERHLRTIAELHTRLTLSFIITPHSNIKLANLDDARAYVRTYLLPMMVADSNQ